MAPSLSPLPVASKALKMTTAAPLSEDDSETQSLSSFSSGPASPSEMPEQFPAAMRPASLDLPSPVSLSEFRGAVQAGPRSEYSGASSPVRVERGECCPLGRSEDHPRLDVADQGLSECAAVWLLT